MANVYDVETALAALIQTAVYPNGTAAPSVANCDVRLYPGEPLPGTLDPDLLARKAHVTVFPGTSRYTTRFETDWQSALLNIQTLFVSTDFATLTVTITGTVTVPQTVMVIVDGTGYAYAVVAGDTLNSIAATLANAIPGATANANVLTVATAKSLDAQISIQGTTGRELARELRTMRISIWAPTPAVRATLGNAINVYLASVYRFILPDNYYAHLMFTGSHEYDILEKVLCYKREVFFDCEYAVTQTLTTATVADNIVNVVRVFEI